VLHGAVTDPELRYRERYADLAVHPEVREVFRLRARVLRAVRSFLDHRGYLEVETPVLQPVYGGAAARPFVTRYEALDATVYLRIADELYLKRCIVGGLEKVYEIGHDFRNEGMDRWHNPEFTMAEWYEAYADYRVMAELTELMLAEVVTDLYGATVLERHGVRLSFAPPFARRDFATLVRATAGVDLATATEQELRAALRRRQVPDPEALSGAKLLDEVFKHYVEPTLVQPTFVLDYPIALSPLAKSKPDDPSRVERWELFVLVRDCQRQPKARRSRRRGAEFSTFRAAGMRASAG
jgi:lysyl-tRNA synthetase class 2